MRTPPVVLPCLLLFCNSLALSQITASSQTAGPPAAASASGTANSLSLADAALSAHGGGVATLHNSVTTGTLHFAHSDLPVPVTIKTSGNAKVRVELDKPDGRYTRILANGRAVGIDPRGKARVFLANNTLAERVLVNPALSLLSEIHEKDLRPANVGAETLGKQNVWRISLSCLCDGAPEAEEFFRKLTKTDVLIDQQTLLIDAIEYRRAAENNANATQLIRVEYSDYRKVSSQMVPFDVKTFAEDQLESELLVQDVSINAPVNAAEFIQPEVK